MAITKEILQSERSMVQQNIQNLESQINKLNQELQQAQTNLIASRGALLAFDRIASVSDAQIEESEGAQ